MGSEGHISASAFLVNESRARNVSLSHDRYARLWVTDETRRLWEDFTREVYPHDAVELSLRNRFFLERLNGAISTGRVSAFINIAAGFTSYPFLINQPVPCFEVDFPHVVDHKRQAIGRWQAEGVLPDRPVEFIAADLNDPKQLVTLQRELVLRLGGVPSFLLMEGLVYYLEPEVLERLYEAWTGLQVPGSVLAFDFWKPDVAEHPVTCRFARFCAERFGHARERYNLFDETSIAAVTGYDIVELTDVQELEQVFAGSSDLADYRTILPEHYALLQRREEAGQETDQEAIDA